MYIEYYPTTLTPPYTPPHPPQPHVLGGGAGRGGVGHVGLGGGVRYRGVGSVGVVR